MRVIDSDAHWGVLKQWRLYELLQFIRKGHLFFRNPTFSKCLNAARSLIAYLARRPDWVRFPVHLKIDVAPLCQLKCPVCTHGTLANQPGRSVPKLMKRPLYEKIVDEVSAHTMVLSLYNLGEPLLNPSLPSMIGYASRRGLSTYITSNLSLPLRPPTIEALVRSNLTMLVVAIDGITDRTFGQQRIGGNLQLITDNIRAINAERKRQDTRGCRICLQFLLFDFNRHEKPHVRRFAAELGVNEVHFVTGATTPWAHTARARTGFNPLPRTLLPRCAWPYFSSLIHSNGEVAACCKYRMNEVYVEGKQTVALGNVSDIPMAEVYQGPSYRTARAMSANPVKAGPHPEHFCAGCGSLYADQPALNPSMLPAHPV